MKPSIQEIIKKKNLSVELKNKIGEYQNFEHSYLSGEGDVIVGLQILDNYEREIIKISKNE